MKKKGLWSRRKDYEEREGIMKNKNNSKIRHVSVVK